MKKDQIKTSVFSVFLLVLLLALTPRLIQAQDTSTLKRQKIGFAMGYGNQNLFPVNLPAQDPHITYKYYVVFLQAQYYYSLTKSRKWGVEVLVQPQFNPTRYRPVDSVASLKNAFEFGVNAGILIRKNLFKDKISIYWFISSGPHFVTGVPKRQVKGFLFSDNTFAGINVKLQKDLYFDMRYGYRHISNAELKHPNGGLDNMVLNLGLYKRF